MGRLDRNCIALEESKTKVRRFSGKVSEKLKPKETKLEVE